MKMHGLDSENGPHAGDMANFTVGKKGKASVTLVNTRVTLTTALTRCSPTAAPRW